jgi:release factor glutamine methyltransferase
VSARPLRPSEYTAALIGHLHARRDWVRGVHALEIGFGSGVVLAALGALGAATLRGVDIEPSAEEEASRLLDRLGYGAVARLHRGDLWGPVAGQRFGLVAANLPHFPMAPVAVAERLPSWSSGGADGRRLLDPFLEGLGRHLDRGGRAVITHNGFVALARSRAVLARSGLALRVAETLLVPIPTEKLAVMTPEVLRHEEGRSVHHYGPHAFGEVHVVEIGTPEALGCAPGREAVPG